MIDSVDAVAGASVDDELAEDAAAILGTGNTPDDEDGPPYVLIIGTIALLALLGGLSLAYFVVYDRDPPLVDLRDLSQG